MKMRKWLSTRVYLAAGLASLTVVLVLAAGFLGFVPDRDALVRQYRVAQSETIALTVSTLLDESDPNHLNDVLQFIVKRNPDILSLGVRSTDGALLVDVGNHAGLWVPSETGQSTEQNLQVPLWREGQAWGTIELHYTALRSAGWLGYLEDPQLRLLAFLGSASFVAFLLYLRRMLRHLDPSRAIPARVRSALDTLTEGLLVLDAKGFVVLANLSLAKVLEIAPDDLIGRAAAKLPWTDRDGRRVDAAALPWLRTLRDSEVQRNGLVYLTRPTGQRCTFRVNSSPVMGPGERSQGVLISLQDVTELEQKELALQVAKDEADQANRAKSEFLSNMSHEIRTPMNAILGFTQVLRRSGKRDAKEARHLETIHSSGQHLLGLLNDILDLSKVEAGRLETERLPFAPHEVVRDAVHTLSVKAEEKGLALTIVHADRLPALILGDASRLRQIVTNLVGNAIKFTPSGAITVKLGTRVVAGTMHYAIDVADSGIGIPLDKLEAVFEPFAQAETSTSRRFGGTGLGLTISRGFARAMGGDISATSAPGQGSTFHVSLDPGPLDDVAWLAGPALSAEVTQVALKEVRRWAFPPAHVLVVDDGVENRELVRVVLEEAGLRVSEADNGQLALDEVARGGVSLVLMDMQMPVMDGVSATRALRASGCSLPIIALTANAMKGFEQVAAQAGFNAFLTKPIDVELLLSTLAGPLGGRSIAADGSDEAVRAPTPSPAAVARAGIEPVGSALVSRYATHPRLQRVVSRFVAEMPERLGSMDDALQRDDMAALAGLGHWLKGAGGSVGFDDLFEPALELERAALMPDRLAAARCIEGLRTLSLRLQSPPALPEPLAAAASAIPIAIETERLL